MSLAVAALHPPLQLATMRPMPGIVLHEPAVMAATWQPPQKELLKLRPMEESCTWPCGRVLNVQSMSKMQRHPPLERLLSDAAEPTASRLALPPCTCVALPLSMIPPDTEALLFTS